MRLLFGVVPAGDMFQGKIDETFKELPNVFGTAKEILIVGYDEDDINYERTLHRVFQTCREGDVKCSKDKCHFSAPLFLFGEIISRYGVQPDPCELCALREMPPPTLKNSYISSKTS